MLNNEPPPGTKVRFLREVRKARANNIGSLRGPLRKYLVETADDQFEVEFEGERITVRRSDIEEA